MSEELKIKKLEDLIRKLSFLLFLYSRFREMLKSTLDRLNELYSLANTITPSEGEKTIELHPPITSGRNVSILHFDF